MQVLFVSEDDICRGPMARVLAQRHASEMGAFGAAFDSCGLRVTRPEHPYEQVVRYLAGENLNVVRHESKPLRGPHVRAADLVLCMTEELARRTRDQVGERFAGKVAVFPEAIGFDSDVTPLTNGSPAAIRTVYSQLKAYTGRLVRMLADGDGPEDFGATASADKAGHLDDPQFRQFAARYIVEFVERAFEPPTSENIAEALQVLGRPVSLLEVEELIREDLSRYLKRTKGRRWEASRQEEPNYRRAPEGEQRTSRERPRGTPPPRSSRDSAMTEQGAYAILSISADTPHGEAAKVYKKLQMRYHPDKFHDDEEFRSLAEEKAKAINQAWLLIKDKLPK